MFDTMTGVKVVGGFCGALLVFLLGIFVAEIIYYGGEGEEENAQQAFVIETGEEESSGGGEEEGGGITFAQAMAKADPSAGESTFRQCASCHVIEEKTNKVGPYLVNVVGRDIASVDSFSYSSALKGVDGSWTPKKLNPWLKDPQQDVSGTKMGFGGLDDIQDRANVIAYLLQHSDYDYTPPKPESANASGGGEGQTGGGGQGQQTAQGGSQGAGGEGQQSGSSGGGQTTTNDGARQEQSQNAGQGSGSGEQQGQQTAQAGGQAGAGGGQSGSGQGVGGSPEFQAAWKKADASAGETIFRRCQACHVADQKQNRVGPYLLGVVGRDIASVESFQYSDALASKEGAWTPGKLSKWLTDPQKFASGTKMSFPGLPDAQDRANVIAYLQKEGG